MKNLTKITIILIILAGSALNVSGQTLKERIDSAKVVKVYFENYTIKHKPNTFTTENESGTNCYEFGGTTAFPDEYLDAQKLIIELLNNGFNTTAFVIGDIKSVPVASGLPEPRSNYLASMDEYFYKANFAYDWLKIGEPLVFYVYSGGYYNVHNSAELGAERELKNFLTLYTSMLAYCPGGKILDYISFCAYKNLVHISSAWLPTKECNDYQYFLKAFPISVFSEDCRNAVGNSVLDFCDKHMDKYEKAMKKKKKRNPHD